LVMWKFEKYVGLVGKNSLYFFNVTSLLHNDVDTF